MAARKAAGRAAPKKTAPRGTARGAADAAFTEEEREAMRERAKEMKKSRSRAAGESEEGDVLEKIAEMPQPDRRMAERLHAIVRRAAPALTPRLWYGMPAYAKDGKVLCFFQAAAKFKARYATLGFSDQAALDDGHLWPTAFALTALGPAEEARIVALLEQAIR